MRKATFRPMLEGLERKENPGASWNPFTALFSFPSLFHHDPAPVRVKRVNGPVVLEGTVVGHRALRAGKPVAENTTLSTTLAGRVSAMGKVHATYSEVQDPAGHILNGQITLRNASGRVQLTFTGQDVLSRETTPTSSTTTAHFTLTSATHSFARATASGTLILATSTGHPTTVTLHTLVIP